MNTNICGIYAGEVVSIKDPEHRGRIKVKIAELLGDSTSSWCEPCVPCCFENGGDFCLPELKDYVWVIFINGELETPVYLGGWWTKDSTPLGKEYKDTKYIRIISFGDMRIEMNKKDNTISISNGDSCNLLVTPNKVTVGNSFEIEQDNITLNGNVSISDSVSMNGTVSITGTLSVNGKVIG